VLANLVVAIMITALQVAVLIARAVLRGHISTSRSGCRLVRPRCSLLAIGMYGVSETLANKIRRGGVHGALPALAIVPFFFAGSLFPITALPGSSRTLRSTAIDSRTALMRYGLLGHNATGLHDIWGMSNTTTMALLSVGVVAMFAAVLTSVSVRTFARAAVH